MVSFSSLLFGVLAASATATLAFEVSFPKSGDYWVSCQNNTLNWSANSTDPSIFSVALLAVQQGTEVLLNGNYQVANSLPTSTGTAMINPNCLPASDSGYYLAFVNSSQYSLNQPQVYYTSPVFSLKPKGTELQKVEANTSADASSQQTSQGAVDATSNQSTDTTATTSTKTASSNAGQSSGASRREVVAGTCLGATVMAASLFIASFA